ncbi:SLC13 family permease [Salipiger mucosus]|uniref:Anion transporter n=1 Tax=Salipiger mucosus DSM 16094 TaxID=1123237 RepID=S9QFX6_9RHOB|nr:DASS family sodium-coupled anion symporter [Salipiger mucosus]EPX78777.1 anion transporter [Salipiger mucosus DSM 16094]
MRRDATERELQAQTNPNHPPHDTADEPIGPGKIAALIAGPVLALVLYLLPAPAGMPETAWHLVAVTAWMVVWWLSEAIPLPATALLPIVLLPILGIQPIDDVTPRYGNDLIFLFLGGFILAGGMQKWGLHRRIALFIVRAIGSTPSRIVMGFMLATAFLSMWISNTATAVMMYAVGVSVIEFIDDRIEDKKLVHNFGVALMLAIAYSASIGGVGTLIGTPPNALMAGILSDSYDVEIGFMQWMLLGVPVVLVMLPLAYIVLTRLAFPMSGLELGSVRSVIDDEYKQLGRMDRGEIIVAVVFGAAAFFWITRSFLGLPIDDSGIAMTAAVLLFALPVGRSQGFVLDWSVARSLPWGVLMLFGGGLALAGAFDSTGLAQWIGDQVASLEGINLWMLIFVVAGAIIVLTEITSNTASTATFLPILGAVAVGLGVAVPWLTVPVALGASMAFMMPVATPPNAIVFSYERMTLSDMVRAGILLNICSAVVVFLAMRLLAGPVFGM